MIWIEDQTQKRMPIDTNAIKLKALRIFTKIKEQEPSISKTQASNFTASHGWFERFKKRHCLHNLKIKGELASGDENAAKEYPAKLAQIIEANSYTPDQVFNADETGLMWKKMPQRTYLAKSQKVASGHKVAKDRVTLLFCSNASGDRIMKPLVINKSLAPRAFKGIKVNRLPVYWMANKKAWVTATVFTEWFHKCFVPEAQKYMAEKGLPFKVLLLVDNAPGHPKDIEHENVRIIFLPPNTTCLIQPLDQGIISTFKALYIKHTFRYILEKMENNDSLSVIEAWKSFTILNCVQHAALAYSEIKSSTLNACWKAIWPQVVKNNTSIGPVEDEYSRIIELAHSLGGEGFDDLANADIQELMVDHGLDEDDLVNMVHVIDDSDSSINAQEESVVLTAKNVREGLEFGRKMGNHFLQIDPNIERAVQFQRELNRVVAKYEEIYKDLTKNQTQLRITDFMTKTRSETITNRPIIDPETTQNISSDESEIQPRRKRRFTSNNKIFDSD